MQRSGNRKVNKYKQEPLRAPCFHPPFGAVGSAGGTYITQAIDNHFAPDNMKTALLSASDEVAGYVFLEGVDKNGRR